MVDKKDHRATEKKVGEMVARMVYLTMVVWTAVKRVDKMEIYWAVKLGDALAY